MMRYLIASLLSVTCSVGLASQDSQSIELTEAQIQASGIQLAMPQLVTSAPGATYPARVIAPPEAEWVVMAPVTAVVERLRVGEGDAVQAGQVLAELRSPELANWVADYQQAQLQARLATAQRDRDQQLLADGIIAAKRWQETEALAAQAEARRRAALERLRLVGVGEREAAQGTTRLVLRAGQAGVVLERFAKPGQRLSDADPVFRLADTRQLWLEIQLPVAVAASIRKGAGMQVAPDGVLARVEQIGLQTQDDTQTVTLRARLEGAAELRPGQRVQVQRQQESAGKAFALPTAALMREGEQVWIFARTAGGFRKVVVELLSQEASTAVVRGELSGEIPVAVQGVAALKAAASGLGAQ